MEHTLGNCSWLNNGLPKDVHTLSPGISEYGTLHGKKDFNDVQKLRILDGEMILDYLGGSSLISGALKCRPVSLAGWSKGRKRD